MALNDNASKGLFIGPTGSVTSFNESSLAYAGQLGQKVRLSNKVYQLVKVDSGSTATADIAPAAALLAYWKNKSAFLVTTDRRFTNYDIDDAGTRGKTNDPNAIAGVFRNSATAGNFTFIQKEGRGEVNFRSGATPLAGDKTIGGAADATGAEASLTAAGTAAAYTELGDILETGVAGATVDVDLFVLD